MVNALNPDPTRYRPDDMNILGRILPVAIAIAITIAVLWAISPGRGDIVDHFEDVPPTSTNREGVKYEHLGSAGCLGAACHGAPAARALKGEIDEGTWQSSGSCWAAADPHTAAYAVLTSTKKDQADGRIKVSAEHIMERYAKETRAVDDVRCLACHTTPALAKGGKTDKPLVLSQRSEGVSCEACHGGAGGWIRQHTTPAWSADRDASYPATGMTRLYDLGERALACAGCHIGAPAEGEPGNERIPVRDMNHDMIAAGHPRLNFDFAEYQRRLPKHWLEKDRLVKGDPKRSPEELKAWELKVWLVGRVAHAEAACKLLNSRAKRAAADDPLTPWPEYAEFNCAACHHNLRAPNPDGDRTGSSVWRADVLRDRDPVFGNRPPGVPPWQSVWPLTPAIGLTPQTPPDLFSGPSAKTYAALKEVVKVMQSPRQPGPSKVLSTADTAAKALAALRLEMVGRGKQKGWDGGRIEAEVKKAFAGLAKDSRVALADAGDWDSGLQLLFGLAASQRASGADVNRESLFRDAFGAYRGPPETETQRWKKMEAAIKQLHPSK